jgi:CheY-like chemotaxis protein
MDIYQDRALVVDDDAASRILFVEHLSSLGYATTAAADGEDAIDILSFDPYYDLIITDIMMPYMAGVEFAAKLKKNALTQKIPIIATSAYPEWGKAPVNQSLFADGFVLKPIDRATLISEIKRVRGK